MEYAGSVPPVLLLALSLPHTAPGYNANYKQIMPAWDLRIGMPELYQELPSQADRDNFRDCN